MSAEMPRVSSRSLDSVVRNIGEIPSMVRYQVEVPAVDVALARVNEVGRVPGQGGFLAHAVDEEEVDNVLQGGEAAAEPGCARVHDLALGEEVNRFRRPGQGKDYRTGFGVVLEPGKGGLFLDLNVVV